MIIDFLRKRKAGVGALKVMRLIIMALFAWTLAGCHGTKGLPEFEIPENFDSKSQYEITFWAKNDTNKAQTDIYAKAIEDFERIYPNIHVNLRLYTDYGKIYNDVITNIATNTTPNVCITYPDHIATYLTGTNIVVPLDGLLEDEKFGLGGTEVLFETPKKSEIISRYLEEGNFDGHYYALPYMRSTEALYINRNMVEKLGYQVPDDFVTWDFVWEVSDAAMETLKADGTYGINGQKILIPFIYKSTDNMVISMLKQQNAGYSTDDGTIEIFNDTTREILDEVADHVGKGSFSTFKISSYPGNFFNAGQCIFAIDSTAGATWMGSNAPLSDIAKEDIVQFETVVRPIPQYDFENVQMISQGPSICIFNKEDNSQVLASWLFAQYMLTNDVQTAYAETEGYVPVTQTARDDAKYLDYLAQRGVDNTTHYDVKIDATKLLLEYTENTFVTPVFNGSASLRDAAGQLIENTAKSVRRKQTVDDAYFDKMYDDIISLYRLDQIDTNGHGKREKGDLGPLPAAAVALLVSLVAVWVMIVTYVIIKYVKAKKNRQ